MIPIQEPKYRYDQRKLESKQKSLEMQLNTLQHHFVASV